MKTISRENSDPVWAENGSSQVSRKGTVTSVNAMRRRPEPWGASSATKSPSKGTRNATQAFRLRNRLEKQKQRKRDPGASPIVVAGVVRPGAAP